MPDFTASALRVFAGYLGVPVDRCRGTLDLREALTEKALAFLREPDVARSLGGFYLHIRSCFDSSRTFKADVLQRLLAVLMTREGRAALAVVRGIDLPGVQPDPSAGLSEYWGVTSVGLENGRYRFSVALDCQKNPYLQDHQVERGGGIAGLLAGVGFLELASGLVSGIHPGSTVTAIKDVDFIHGVFVPEGAVEAVFLDIVPKNGKVAPAADYEVTLLDRVRYVPDTKVPCLKATVSVDDKKQKREISPLPSGHPRAILSGDPVYESGWYPPKGIMRVVDRMEILSANSARLFFSPQVLGSDEGNLLARRRPLPLFLNMGLQGAEILSVFLNHPDPEERLSGHTVPSSVGRIILGADPKTEDLGRLAVSLKRDGENAFRFDVVNIGTGERLARVTGLRTIFWERWGRLPEGERPTRRAFLGV